MNTCDTCKWWEANFHGTRDVAPTSCMNPKLRKAYWEEVGVNEAASYDESSRKIPSLVTGPKFGCIHHERLEPTSQCVEYGGMYVLGGGRVFSIGYDSYDSDGNAYMGGYASWRGIPADETNGTGTIEQARAARDKFLGRTEYAPVKET